MSTYYYIFICSRYKPFPPFRESHLGIVKRVRWSSIQSDLTFGIVVAVVVVYASYYSCSSRRLRLLWWFKFRTCVGLGHRGGSDVVVVANERTLGNWGRMLLMDSIYRTTLQISDAPRVWLLFLPPECTYKCIT